MLLKRRRAQVPLLVAVNSVDGVSGAVRAEFTLWVIRPLVYIITHRCSPVHSLQQLYLKNPTFWLPIHSAITLGSQCGT